LFLKSLNWFRLLVAFDRCQAMIGWMRFPVSNADNAIVGDVRS
jgi:hypothetical protein